jgi:hypothetical protein
MAKNELGFMIYRVSWEIYDDEGCYEVFYTDWHLDKKATMLQQMELLELSKVRKDIHVNEIEQEFVVCSREEVENLANKIFPLIEE